MAKTTKVEPCRNCPKCGLTLARSKMAWMYCPNKYPKTAGVKACTFTGFKATDGGGVVAKGPQGDIEPLKTPSDEQTAIIERVRLFR